MAQLTLNIEEHLDNLLNISNLMHYKTHPKKRNPPISVPIIYPTIYLSRLTMPHSTFFLFQVAFKKRLERNKNVFRVIIL